MLLTLIRRVAKTLGVLPQAIAEILLTRYPPEAGIGWHRDAPAFGDVFGISLKNSCTLKLRSSRETGREAIKLELEHRSAYLLSGEARWSWCHSIPPVKHERYSITLRTLRWLYEHEKSSMRCPKCTTNSYRTLSKRMADLIRNLPRPV